MKKFRKMFALTLFLLCSNAFANECPPSERMKNYNELRLQLSNMHDLMPALKPQDKAFYKEVSENIYSKPDKYRRYASDDGYVVYENTVLLENFIHWTDVALNSVKSSNYKAEVHAFNRLMLGAVRDVKWLDGVRDSKYMAEKGIVPIDYKNKGEKIAIAFGSLALCMADHTETLMK